MPKIQSAATIWLRREDYDRFLEVSDDRSNLPATFDEWEKKSERKLAQFKSRFPGEIKKIVADPDQLATFCESRGIKCDAEGRSAFAASRAGAERSGN